MRGATFPNRTHHVVFACVPALEVIQGPRRVVRGGTVKRRRRRRSVERLKSAIEVALVAVISMAVMVAIVFMVAMVAMKRGVLRIVVVHAE